MRDILITIAAFIWLWVQSLQNFLGNKPNIINLPQKRLEIASPSAVLNMPQQPTIVDDNTPWGTTEKVGEHLYRTYVGNDPRMGTPEEILTALNAYRANHHRSQLQLEPKLCPLAQKRAQDQSNQSGLDSHKGLTEYMNSPNSWQELNVTGIGENASFGYVLSGVHLVEWVFDADEEHRDNQLNPDWNLACAGVYRETVDILFGKK